MSRDRNDLDDDVRAVLATEAGKRVLLWVLGECGIYRDPFAGDSDATSYTVGQQSVGRKIIGQLDAIDPREYPRLLLWAGDVKAMDEAADRNQAGGEDEGDDAYA